MRRRLVAVLVAAVLAGDVAALLVHDEPSGDGVAQQGEPPTSQPPTTAPAAGPRLRIADLHPGAVSLLAEGFPAARPAVISLAGTVVGEHRTSDDGTFRVYVPLPASGDELEVVADGVRATVHVPGRRSGGWPAGARPFADDSPFNRPIPDDPVVDEGSDAMVRWLASGPGPGVADLYEYGVPIWEVDGPVLAREVPCTITEWGTCGLAGSLVPMPPDAKATDVRDDGAMVVVDRHRRRSYEFFRAEQVDGSWRTGWGGVLELDGWGVGSLENSATGAAISRLAGVVRASEIAAGRIDHALVFSTDNACQEVWRYPAAKTDGDSPRDDCIPEGARIQLDPSIDVDAIAGLTPGERTVARALQRHGAYAIDNGGARMAFIFEVPSGEPDPYPAAGLTKDYFNLRLPWERLRVLREWDGS